MEYYNTIAQKAVAEYKDRGSKFIAYAFPVVSADECKQQFSILKKEHPKAAHHCFAYRIGIDGNNFRSSDDGEPAGTAGKPILGQIHSKELTDICIVVVRYFGGTLLGVPGLINAYKTAATLVLQVVPVLQKSIEIKYKLHFDYTQQNEVLTIIKQYNCTILAQEMQLFCDITIGIPISRLQEVLYKLNEIKQLEMHQLK